MLTPHVLRSAPGVAPEPGPPPAETLAAARGGRAASTGTAAGTPTRSTAPKPRPADSRADNAPDSGVVRASFVEEQVDPNIANGVPNGRAVEHTVQRGETYWTISRTYYGSGRFCLSIWYANRRLTRRPETLRVGETIVIPPQDELDRTLEMDTRTNRLLDGTSWKEAVDEALARQSEKVDFQVTRAGLDDPDRVAGDRRSREVEGRPVHVVGRFESLRTIARDRLGDGPEALETPDDVEPDGLSPPPWSGGLQQRDPIIQPAPLEVHLLDWRARVFPPVLPSMRRSGCSISSVRSSSSWHH